VLNNAEKYVLIYDEYSILVITWLITLGRNWPCLYLHPVQHRYLFFTLSLFTSPT